MSQHCYHGMISKPAFPYSLLGHPTLHFKFIETWSTAASNSSCRSSFY